MWLLFVPILVLVLLMFTTASVFAGLMWVAGSGWPLLLIGLGMWMLLKGGGRHHRGRQESSRGCRTPPLKLGQQPAVSHKRREKRVAATPELPIDIQVKVEQIHRKVDVLLGFADRFPPFSQDLYLVRQTASDYLPRTIDTFLGLPTDAVDRPIAPGARTAREELKSQLDLLDAKLDEIAQDLQRQDADRLLANRRFLESRFGARAEAAKLTPTADVA